MYFKHRKPEDGLIDWNNFDSKKTFNFVRALTKPYPGAFSLKKNKEKVFIFKCKRSNLSKKGLVPGQVLIMKKRTYIKTKNNFIRLVNFQGKLNNNELLLSKGL